MAAPGSALTGMEARGRVAVAARHCEAGGRRAGPLWRRDAPGAGRFGAAIAAGVVVGRGRAALLVLSLCAALGVGACSDPPRSAGAGTGPDTGPADLGLDGQAQPDTEGPDVDPKDTGDLDATGPDDASDADVGDVRDADGMEMDTADGVDAPDAEGVRDVFVTWLDEVRPENPGQVVTGARAQRLRVDALRRAVTIVAGNDAAGRPITWRVPRSLYGTATLHRYRRYDLFTGTYDVCTPSSPTSSRCDGFHDLVYGRVLGRPDFYEVPLEGRAIDLTYAKLVRDMAWNVCDQMIRADLLRADPGGNSLSIGRAVTPTPDEATLRIILGLLVLKFHGSDAAVDSLEIDALLTLFRAGVAAVEHPELDPLPAEAEGYRAVCVALFEDPAFHLW